MTGETTRIGPILVAVDFSADSRAALAWAFDEAVKWSLPVTVLHVIHDPLDAPGYYRKLPEAASRPLSDVAEEMMKQFLDKALPEIDTFPEVEAIGFETRLVAGVPASRILEVAGAIGASMIVMGSRGQTGLKHLMLGSKAERVVQLAAVPVTIVKAPKEGDR